MIWRHPSAGTTVTVTCPVNENNGMNLLDKIDLEQMRFDIPEFRPGDTVKVHIRIIEGNKERVQVFQGVVIKRKRGTMDATFTVRKISHGVGVEKTFATPFAAD
jgi:large subunit ribosomal protein L19